MKGRRNALVAGEGVPLMLVAAVTMGLGWYYIGWSATILPALILVALYMLFRDPLRVVPSQPLAVVSPVDGIVADVSIIDDGPIGQAAHKIIIRIDSLGTYTARSPVEGMIHDYHRQISKDGMNPDAPGLWVQTDEGENVVLRFHGNRFGLVPKAFYGYGERVGQGQRCAYLRLARYAEVYLPINSRLTVESGTPLIGGSDILGTLPHP